jgi:antitoxin HigA-1
LIIWGEIHPGEILIEEFIKPMGLTNAQLASDIAVPTSRIREIVNGKRPIMVDTVVRLGVYFNMEPRFWRNLQAEYDVQIAEHALLPEINDWIRPLNDQSAPSSTSVLDTGAACPPLVLLAIVKRCASINLVALSSNGLAFNHEPCPSIVTPCASGARTGRNIQRRPLACHLRPVGCA